MNIRYSLDEKKFANDLSEIFEEVKTPVEKAMAVRFEDAVRANFGFIGFERPNEWADLSPEYARRVGRTVATLEVTGAMKAQLRSEENVVKITNDVVTYATFHESGTSKMPKRALFPMEDGECMPKTLELVMNAAQNELRRILT